jgi:hypothetical protein
MMHEYVRLIENTVPRHKKRRKLCEHYQSPASEFVTHVAYWDDRSWQAGVASMSEGKRGHCQTNDMLNQTKIWRGMIHLLLLFRCAALIRSSMVLGETMRWEAVFLTSFDDGNAVQGKTHAIHKYKANETKGALPQANRNTAPPGTPSLTSNVN